MGVSVKVQCFLSWATIFFVSQSADDSVADPDYNDVAEIEVKEQRKRKKIHKQGKK